MKSNHLRLFGITIMSLAIFAVTPMFAQKENTVMVGEAAMYPSKNMMENAVNSKDHTILVAAIKAAGLWETLSDMGPFTVIAPTNAAFYKLPKNAVDNLLKPENKETLTNILTFHVITGKLNSTELMMKIKEGNGKAKIKTVQGGILTFIQKDNEIWVIDSKGNQAKITIKDVYQSNGIVHVIDAVMMP